MSPSPHHRPDPRRSDHGRPRRTLRHPRPPLVPLRLRPNTDHPRMANTCRAGGRYCQRQIPSQGDCRIFTTPYLPQFCVVPFPSKLLRLDSLVVGNVPSWIVLPYVAFRFGLRNRLTYLAGTLFLLGLPVYTLRPQVFQFTGLACALVIVAALASPLWHRQMLFLIANAVVSRLIFYVCINDPLRIFHPHQHLHPMSLFRMRIDDPVAIVITIMIGPPLYRWLLQPRPKGVANAEPA